MKLRELYSLIGKLLDFVETKDVDVTFRLRDELTGDSVCLENTVTGLDNNENVIFVFKILK